MIKFLIFLMIFTAVECHTTSKANKHSVNPVIIEKLPVGDCHSDLEERIKPLFNSYYIEEGEIDKDEEFLNELKSRPREETIKCLLELRTRQKNDFELLAKTSYLLVKLKHNEYENGKILVSSYLLYNETILKWRADKNYAENLDQGKYNVKFSGDLILSLLGDVIENHNSEILSETFDLIGHTDGASSEVISHIFAGEFEKNPINFLRVLKPKSKKNRQDIYLFIYYSIGKQKVSRIISSIPKNSDVNSSIQEIEEFAKTNKFVSEMQ